MDNQNYYINMVSFDGIKITKFQHLFILKLTVYFDQIYIILIMSAVDLSVLCALIAYI